MTNMLKKGIYETAAGSTVIVSGNHNGVYDIDFDWLEENACCDATPFILDGELHWACDCCEEEEGVAKLIYKG